MQQNQCFETEKHAFEDMARGKGQCLEGESEKQNFSEIKSYLWGCCCMRL